MALELDNVSRHFGGVRAVDGVSFGVAEGTVHGLIGPNGAGKTTVLNLISGLMPVTGGRITLDGVRIDGLGLSRILVTHVARLASSMRPLRPVVQITERVAKRTGGAEAHLVAGMGVRRTFQNIRLFPVMTALDNVIAGEHTRRRAGTFGHIVFHPSAMQEAEVIRGRAHALLKQVGLAGRDEQQARNLSYGEQRRLEIARALAGDPRLLLLDEPAAGMPFAEMRDLGALIRSIAADGHTVLLVEHNMELVMSICDRITVLDFGRVIAEGAPAEISTNPAVISAYLGAEP
ncbi:MAG: ABC transporter ATP-binding protein [Chloroflexi bacterium]|nr:ABC transporter ATP-binding protein [Chloroflexota bacterium]